MKPIDIGPADLETVRRILQGHVPELDVWAFGSRVSWTARETSDLDIALMATEPLDVMRLAEMREAFVQSDLPFRVDIVDWSSTSKAFQNIIERNHVAVQKKTTRSKAGNRWHKTALGDVVDLRISGVDKKTKHNEHAIHLCNYTDVYNNSFIHSDLDFMTATATELEISNCTLNAEDVIITKDSEKHDDIGVPALVRENIPNLVCGYHLVILRPSLSDIDGAYLFYALTTDDAQHQFQSYANGITRFGLRKADIGLIEIPLPPLPDQHVIGHILRTLDDKIELNRQMNRTLEEMARALFKSWFVNFDPVRAKMDGRWRPGESLSGLPAHLYDLFSDSLMDSELGEIPKGWEVKALREIAEQRRSGANPAEIDPNTPYIALEHMPKCCIALSEWGTADGLASSKYRFKQGNILFGKLRPYFHKVGVAPLDGVCSTDIVVMSPISQDWFGFILGHASSSEFIDYTDAGSTGTKMPRTKWVDMGRYKVASPSQELAKAFTELIQPCIDKIIFAIHDSCALVAKRDALLPKLISGELHAFQLACERNTTR